MSLELAAQHLASRGRKGDTMLVHMAPEEVSGLQALARAGGGTLTLNPDTGLPEANFLKRMLPMIIGAGLAATGVGAPMAAMLVGGGYGAAKGSLREGLMAGLSAYGGAGLAGGLSAAAGTGAASSATGAAGANSVVPELASQGAGVSVTPLGAETLNLSHTGSNLFGGGPSLAQNLNLQAQQQAAQAASMVPTTTPLAATPYPTAVSGGPSLAQNLNLQAQQQAASMVPTTTPPAAAVTPPQGAFSKMKSGLQALNTPQGREAFIGNAASKGVEATGVGGYGGLAKYGAAALSPVMMGEEPDPYTGGGPNPYNFAFDWERPEGPSYDSREAMQLRGRLRRIPNMAAGGPIEEMSDRNQMQTMMANGGQMFAEGGETKADVAKGMTGASADAFRYLMGQSNASPATVAAQQFAAKPASAPLPMPPQQQPTGPMEDDPDRPYNFNFDPTSGQLTAGPRAQRAVQYPEFLAAAGGIASMARGGISHLGDYSDGGRLLKGPGDGVSDSIPATIANKRPARLADGEFVVPARIVSELGNGSTEAGARKLYAMMDRVQKARKKSIGKNRVAVNSRADKLLPA
jgi:hypothetical protein